MELIDWKCCIYLAVYEINLLIYLFHFFLVEAFSILKHAAAKFQPPLHLHDDNVELIDTVERPSHAISWQETSDIDEEHYYQEHNHNHYEYLPEDDTPRKRMARLVKRISRMDDISNGIYHPTLVPFEDKRIAGVSF